MDSVIVIACSTGGPDALKTIISGLPRKHMPPVVIFQHMKEKVTTSLSRRLGTLTSLKVVEIGDAFSLKRDTIYVAPGGHNVTLKKVDKHYILEVRPGHYMGASVSPNADIFLESLANTDIARILCIVLTGMGKDSLKGIDALKKAKMNLKVFTQSQESCAIYGMPKAVVNASYSDQVFDINDMAKAISKEVETWM